MFIRVPESGHEEITCCCTRWKQHLFQLVFCCQFYRPMLKLQGEPIDGKLHVKLHIADKSLQQPGRGTESERNMWVGAFFQLTSVFRAALTFLRSPASHCPALLCEHIQCTQWSVRPCPQIWTPLDSLLVVQMDGSQRHREPVRVYNVDCIFILHKL